MAYKVRSIVSVAVVVALAAAGGVTYYYGLAPGIGRPAGVPGGPAGKAADGPQGGFAMAVEAAAVKVGPSQRQVLAIGTLRSNESVIVRPEIAGRITEIPFDEGRKVKKGRVLVQFDNAIQKAELVQAEASLALSRANFERAQELMKRGAGTQRAFDEARSKLRSDEAAVQLSRARLDKLAIVAPFDGVIGLRKVSVGDYVNVGADIANLEMIDPLKVDFRVAEIFLAAIRPGQKIAVALDAMPGRSFEGEVFAIDPLIEATGRSIVIRARIANPEDVLRPGLFARVTLTIEARPNALWVPEESLVPIGDQQFVFKIAEGKVAFTRVQIGERRRGVVEIVAGLNEGDSVVTAGLLKIRDGMPVMVVPSEPPAAAPAGQSGAPAPGAPAPNAGPAKSGSPSVAETAAQAG